MTLFAVGPALLIINHHCMGVSLGTEDAGTNEYILSITIGLNLNQ